MRLLVACLALIASTKADYIDDVLDVAVKEVTGDVPPVAEYLLHGQCGTPEAPLHRPLDMIQYHLKMIISDIFEEHCHVEGGSFTDYFMSPDTECVDLIFQSYCYTQRECDRSMDEGLTFDQLKLAIPDIGEVTKTWCSSKCTQKILGYAWKCYMDPEVKPFVVQKISEKFALLKAVAVTYEEYLEGSPVGRILSVALKNTKEWNDVGLYIKHNRPAILKLFSDLRYNFADFCDAGCVDAAFPYASALVDSMAHGECDHPREFCGACQAHAREFFADRFEHMPPCCASRLVDWVLGRTDAGVAAAQGYGNAYLFSDIAVLSSQNEDFQCWRSVVEPAVYKPGLIWMCSLGKTM